jgi:hypothetical protein
MATFLVGHSCRLNAQPDPARQAAARDGSPAKKKHTAEPIAVNRLFNCGYSWNKKRCNKNKNKNAVLNR